MIFLSALCVGISFHFGRATLLDSFNKCLISTPSSLGYCLGIGTLSQLQSIDSNPEFDIADGVTFARDEQVRENHNFLDRDPVDFRTIVDSIGNVFSRRSMHWDMSNLYPGLAMRIAPSHSPGGVLEFMLDTHREALSHHPLQETSTGRLMARQFLLPFLLGFKFNVATLIPIIFGALALIAKKFILLSKIGLIISSAIGLSTLLFKAQQHTNYGGHQSNFGGHYGHGSYNRFPEVEEDSYMDTLVRKEKNPIVFNIEEVLSREQPTINGKRNFAWNDLDKKKKL
ncbi:hypothetical protein FQA39_LY14799 [Lamprigera yunnana]|nr:hypothetical protein FQA39_LY14799 [Lamprigera yunnana]